MKQKEELNSFCPICHTVFECGISAGKSSCWCFAHPSFSLTEYSERCLCEKCLKELIEKQHMQSASK
jgi:hypothetical protein